MNFFDRSLLVQLLVVISRPIAFILSISVLSDSTSAEKYLMAVGLIPMFAIADIYFQASARHAFISGASPQRIKSVLSISVVVLFGYLIAAVLSLVYFSDITFAIATLIAVYFFSAILNKYEGSISSSNAIFLMSILELLGYLLCVVIALTEAVFIAAICTTMIFPLARIITITWNQRNQSATPIALGEVNGRTIFIGSAVSSQILSSLAASAPSIVLFAIPEGLDRIGSALIAFKILFTASALWSTAFNLLSSRVFYGDITLSMGLWVPVVRSLEKVIFAGLVVGLMGGLTMLNFMDISVFFFFVLLGVAFSYLNLLSSLAFMYGRPSVTAAAQACVFVSSFGLASLINESFIIAYISLLLFLIGFYVLARRVRVSNLLKNSQQ